MIKKTFFRGIGIAIMTLIMIWALEYNYPGFDYNVCILTFHFCFIAGTWLRKDNWGLIQVFTRYDE